MGTGVYKMADSYLTSMINKLVKGGYKPDEIQMFMYIFPTVTCEDLLKILRKEVHTTVQNGELIMRESK